MITTTSTRTAICFLLLHSFLSPRSLCPRRLQWPTALRPPPFASASSSLSHSASASPPTPNTHTHTPHRPRAVATAQPAAVTSSTAAGRSPASAPSPWPPPPPSPRLCALAWCAARPAPLRTDMINERLELQPERVLVSTAVCTVAPSRAREARSEERGRHRTHARQAAGESVRAALDSTSAAVQHRGRGC